ncbi:hypothetical protein L1887_61332 [Cichorium endivia]|nr:hypothetical protein L1887_61332 [Cichorium endivia]
MGMLQRPPQAAAAATNGHASSYNLWDVISGTHDEDLFSTTLRISSAVLRRMASMTRTTPSASQRPPHNPNQKGASEQAALLRGYGPPAQDDHPGAARYAVGGRCGTRSDVRVGGVPLRHQRPSEHRQEGGDGDGSRGTRAPRYFRG